MRQGFLASVAATALALVCGNASAQEALPDESAAAPVSPPADAAEPAAAEATDAVASQPEPLATIPVDPGTQEPAEPAPEATVKNRLVEEIIVTAQKREDNIQDVPISIQAFSSEALSVRNIVNTQDLGSLVPSLRFTEAAGYTLIYMRGIGTSQFVPSADPSIATYIDGIYIPQGQGGVQSLSLGNTERVEVLKGPQGTLFGRNTIGGAINIISKNPSKDEYVGSGEVSYSDLNYKTARAGVSGPVTSWLAASVDGAYTDNENYLDATLYRVPHAKTKSVRAKVQFEPLDTLSFGLTGLYSKLDNAQLSIGQNTEPSMLGDSLMIAPQGDDFTVGNDLPAQSTSNLKIAYANLTWNLPWLDFKLLGSSQEVNIPRYDYDFDGSEKPYVGFDTTNEFTHARTAEVQFVSSDESWRGDRFKWIVGLYWYNGTGAFDPARFHAAPAALAGAPQAVTDLFARVPLSSTPVGPQGFSLALRGILETDSYSAFTQGTYSFTDWLDLTLGGRYQDEQRDLIKAETNAIQPDGETESPLLKFPLMGEREYNFSPKAQISVRPLDDTLIYASYTKGYKSGTYNIVNIYTAPDYIVPEEVQTYELGGKADFLGGALRLNAAYFYNELKNLQDGFVSLLSGGAVSFNTAPAARTRGGEFDLLLLPLPTLNPGLVLTANAAYVDGIYTDFPNGEGFEQPGGVYSDNLDLTGFRLRNTPKRSGSLGLVQTISLNKGSLELGGDVYYNSGFFYNANNTVREPAYKLYNARLSYAYDPWQVRVTVFGQNLADERNHVAKFETDFGLLTTLAPPRAVGMSLSWAF